MPPAEILGIVETLFIVRANIKDDRQRPFRTNAADQSVE
jgi:hypothetical protein